MNKHSIILIRASLVLLITAVLFGTIASFVFLQNNAATSWLPFHKLRPLHVSAAVFWILTAAIGSVMYYMNELRGSESPLKNTGKAFNWLWILTIATILISFLAGKFGGREYWEFPPVLSIPLLVSVVLLAVIFFNTFIKLPKKKPVYLWMWSTGVIFFFFTFLESNLWLLPWFRDNIIRDITVQWKSNGAVVGSWNLLVYGTGIYIMTRISGNDKTARSPLAFFMYFLGLTFSTGGTILIRFRLPPGSELFPTV
jgi:nitric oxide reductase subunit B